MVDIKVLARVDKNVEYDPSSQTYAKIISDKSKLFLVVNVNVDEIHSEDVEKHIELICSTLEDPSLPKGKQNVVVIPYRGERPRVYIEAYEIGASDG